MANLLPKSVRNLIEELARLPGIGPKSAQRLAIYLLRSPDERVKSLGNAVSGLKDNIVFCETCWNIAESNPCRICGSSDRDKGIVCVVEEVLDVVAIEKTHDFNGVYHVLHGALSPIDNVGPDQLKLVDLFERVEKSCDKKGVRSPTKAGSLTELAKATPWTGLPCEENLKIHEIILATNPSLEGEATALYIQRYLKDFDVKITRIARGLPVGGDVEYADEVTLSRAISGRAEF